MDYRINCEIELVAPPKDVGFCLQQGKAELVDYVLSDGSDIVFRFDVRVGEQKDGAPNFLGPFTQGRPTERFVYVCIGRGAGQFGSIFNGRAKVPLTGIDWEMIEQVNRVEDGVLVARYAGTGRAGAPAMATVPLLDGGWRVRNS